MVGHISGGLDWTRYSMVIGCCWLKGIFWSGLPQVDINYFDQNAWHTSEAGAIVQWQSLNNYATDLHDAFLSLWMLPVAIGSATWMTLAWYLYQLGSNQVDHDVIEGVQLVSPEVYQKTLGKQACDIQLGNVPWVKNAEVQHLFRKFNKR